MTRSTGSGAADLVKRIRARPNDATLETEYMLDDAADEIDRLTAEVARLRAGWLDQAARDCTEIVRLEMEIERLREALQMFCDHYSHGINPYLDEAYSLAHTALTKETT